MATSNVALYCNAKVDFVDINLSNYNICVRSLEKKLIETSKKKLPKILIVTHIGGVPSNLEKINKLSKNINLK